MADSGKEAITTYNGDGSTTTFAVGFNFLAAAHILVEVGLSPPVAQVLDTDYTISSDGVNVVFTTIPASGTGNVKFTRQTPHPALFVDFTAGAGVTATDLDNSTLQGIYFTEEVKDMI